MRVDQLDGDLLDYWVSQAEINAGYITEDKDDFSRPRLSSGYYYVARKTGVTELGLQHGKPAHSWGASCGKYEPSKDWQFGGPIIERMQMFISPPNATVHRNGGPHSGWGESAMWTASTKTRGPTGAIALGCDKNSPLIAAMRARVRFEFGDEVPDVEPATTLEKGIV